MGVSCPRWLAWRLLRLHPVPHTPPVLSTKPRFVRNVFGQLGDGTKQERTLPVKALGLTKVVEIAAGEHCSLVRRRDGTVWAWGYNGVGLLGDSGPERTTAAPVPGLDDVETLSLHTMHALALKQDGTVWAWGGNNFGQLGDGTFDDRSTPVQVPGLDGVQSIAASWYTSVAVRGDGSVWTWGTNGMDYEMTLAPRRVEGLPTVRAVSVSWVYSYALATDGTLWQWFGYGPGSAPPIQVAGMTDVVSFAHTEGNSLHVVRADGTVWGKGFNDNGVLGVPGLVRAEDWVQVPGLTDVVSLSMNSLAPRVLALRANGTAVGWGANLSGTIGDGISDTHLTPTRVLMPCRLPAVSSLEEAQSEVRHCRAEP